MSYLHKCKPPGLITGELEARIKFRDDNDTI
jgi:hypothetical protein